MYFLFVFISLTTLVFAELAVFPFIPEFPAIPGLPEVNELQKTIRNNVIKNFQQFGPYGFPFPQGDGGGTGTYTYTNGPGAHAYSFASSQGTRDNFNYAGGNFGPSGGTFVSTQSSPDSDGTHVVVSSPETGVVHKFIPGGGAYTFVSKGTNGISISTGSNNGYNTGYKSGGTAQGYGGSNNIRPSSGGGVNYNYQTYPNSKEQFSGNYEPGAGGAYAGASLGSQGAHQVAGTYPENPKYPNINTRYGPSGSSGGTYSVFSSSQSSSSNINGKPSHYHKASTTVNDNGKITTYTAQYP